jgi:flagellar protein FlbD
VIKVTRLNNSEIVINSELIEFVESSPDTIISLTDGKKIMVKESPDQIIRKVADFKRLSFGIEVKEKEVQRS